MLSIEERRMIWINAYTSAFAQLAVREWDIFLKLTPEQRENSILNECSIMNDVIEKLKHQIDSEAEQIADKTYEMMEKQNWQRRLNLLKS